MKKVEAFVPVQEEQPHKKNIWFDLWCVWMLQAGFFLTLFVRGNDARMWQIMCVAGMAGSAVMMLTERYTEHGMVLRFLAGGAALVILLLQLNRIVQELLYCVNGYIAQWNDVYHGDISLFALAGYDGGGRIWFGVEMVLLTVLGIHGLVCKKKLLTLTGVCFLLVFGVSLLGIMSIGGGVFCIVSGWIGCWINDRTGTAELGWRTLAIYGLTAAALGGGVYIAGNIPGAQAVVTFRQWCIDSTREYRYGKDSLPQGDLTKASTLVDGEEERLKVTLPKSQKLYLRGYVGAEYEGQRWAEPAKDAYRGEQKGMLAWLMSQGFYSVSQYADYERLMGAEAGKPENSLKVSVENTGADRRYVYLPQQMSDLVESNVNYCYDWQVRSNHFRGADAYSFSMIPTDVPSELMVQEQIQGTSASDYERYQNAENVYRTFVYKNYVDVDEEIRSWIHDYFFANGQWDTEQVSLYQATLQIRSQLQQKVHYQERPEDVPEGQDFVTWFLGQSREGNAVSYATAAVLAYRVLGIPARYVEGYFLSDQVKAFPAVLKTGDAHAWAEVYIDEIGWMPVEVVPGYYPADYTTTQVLGIPESTISIAHDSSQSSLSGNTTDRLDQSEHGKNLPEDEEKTPVEQAVYTLAYVLLVLIAAELSWILLKLQRKCRIRSFQRKIFSGDTGESGRLLYRKFEKLLAIGGIAENGDFPYELAEVMKEQYPELSQEDYKRFLQLSQKNVFGGETLEQYEIQIMKTWNRNLTAAVWKKGGWWKRWKMKYVYCML